MTFQVSGTEKLARFNLNTEIIYNCIHGSFRGSPCFTCGPILFPQDVNSPDLLQELRDSLQSWDEAYIETLTTWPAEEKMTEDRLKIRVRNVLRKDGVELPEIVRWKLKAKYGGPDAESR